MFHYHRNCILINNMAATYTVEALQDILRASATFHTQSLDLSKRNIDQLPEDFPTLQNLLGLYLEGNRLVVFPEDILLKLRNLRWLDLRNNQLTTLPSNIDYLRELRTLLLENNQLTSLPHQLGALRHLNGLNIANNPLQYPPAHIIQQGTKVVLRYLADNIDDYVFADDETLDDGSQPSWHTPEFTSGNTGAISNTGGKYHGYHCLPVPSSQKVLLHVQTDPLHRVMNNKQLPMVNGRQDDGTQRRHNRKPFKTDRISKTTNNKITPRELSQAENERISDIIDRQRSTRQLEEWREEAKRQRQHSNNVALKPKTTEFAPYGNDLQEPFPSQERLQTVENRRNAMAKKLQKYYNKGIATSTVKEDSTQESDNDENDVIHPSTVRPAVEGVHLEPGWEAKRAREYRLSAFTGDILVQTDNS